MEQKAISRAWRSSRQTSADRRSSSPGPPEPLPEGHILFKLPNAVVSPHIGGQSPEVAERAWRLYRENVRRFVAGEPLLCVVDKEKGY